MSLDDLLPMSSDHTPFLDSQGFSALFKLQPYNVFGVGDITAAPVYEYAFPKIRSYAPKVKFDD